MARPMPPKPDMYGSTTLRAAAVAAAASKALPPDASSRAPACAARGGAAATMPRSEGSVGRRPYMACVLDRWRRAVPASGIDARLWQLGGAQANSRAAMRSARGVEPGCIERLRVEHEQQAGFAQHRALSVLDPVGEGLCRARLDHAALPGLGEVDDAALARARIGNSAHPRPLAIPAASAGVVNARLTTSVPAYEPAVRLCITGGAPGGVRWQDRSMFFSSLTTG